MTTARRNAQAQRNMKRIEVTNKKNLVKRNHYKWTRKVMIVVTCLTPMTRRRFNQWSNWWHDEQSLFTGDETKYEAKLRRDYAAS
jgi:uncharacterized membrane protein YvbJ